MLLFSVCLNFLSIPFSLFPTLLGSRRIVCIQFCYEVFISWTALFCSRKSFQSVHNSAWSCFIWENANQCFMTKTWDDKSPKFLGVDICNNWNSISCQYQFVTLSSISDLQSYGTRFQHLALIESKQTGISVRSTIWIANRLEILIALNRWTRQFIRTL